MVEARKNEVMKKERVEYYLALNGCSSSYVDITDDAVAAINKAIIDMDACLVLTGIVIVILIFYSIFLHCMKKSHARWIHEKKDNP